MPGAGTGARARPSSTSSTEQCADALGNTVCETVAAGLLLARMFDVFLPDRHTVSPNLRQIGRDIRSFFLSGARPSKRNDAAINLNVIVKCALSAVQVATVVWTVLATPDPRFALPAQGDRNEGAIGARGNRVSERTTSGRQTAPGAFTLCRADVMRRP